MEIAAGQDRGVGGEDERVVGRRVDLARQHGPGVIEGVLHRAVHLGDAAQRIGVLHLVAVQVGEADFAAGHEGGDLRGGPHLARVRPDGLDARVERRVGADEGVGGHGGDHGGDPEQVIDLIGQEAADGGHEVGAVEHRQTLLGLERHGGDTGLAERLAAGQHPALVPRFAFTHEHQRQMGRRGQIAAGADGPFLRDHRQDVAGQHAEQGVHHHGPDA